ncbi:MAG: MBL fold metallo-hydrolase [Candidatus Pristimantibacillus sp.]
MKIHFLGTAAFEGMPAMFCSCDGCKKSKELGGHNIRTRTSVMVDNELKIDFPPDTYMHMLRDGLDLDQMKDLIFTHSHSDHLYAEDLAARLPGYAQSGDHTIQVYGNELTISKCMAIINFNGGVQGRFNWHLVKPFQRVEMQTATIIPLVASHDPLETCLLYYIEKDGKSILYGHDTGDFPEETWEWLKDKKLDLAILECTMGNNSYRATHMNIDAVLETKQQFEKYEMMNAGSRIVVTHFSHNMQLMHEDLTAIFEPHAIITAYDGMILEL